MITPAVGIKSADEHKGNHLQDERTHEDGGTNRQSVLAPKAIRNPTSGESTDESSEGEEGGDEGTVDGRDFVVNAIDGCSRT